VNRQGFCTTTISDRWGGLLLQSRYWPNTSTQMVIYSSNTHRYTLIDELTRLPLKWSCIARGWLSKYRKSAGHLTSVISGGIMFDECYRFHWGFSRCCWRYRASTLVDLVRRHARCVTRNGPTMYPRKNAEGKFQDIFRASPDCPSFLPSKALSSWSS
jgi:hypothetical protein